MIAWVLNFPFEWGMGEELDIPRWWALMNGCFGLAEEVPLALGWRWAGRLELMSPPV